jgi:hypothetical protein
MYRIFNCHGSSIFQIFFREICADQNSCDRRIDLNEMDSEEGIQDLGQ